MQFLIYYVEVDDVSRFETEHFIFRLISSDNYGIYYKYSENSNKTAVKRIKRTLTAVLIFDIDYVFPLNFVI